MLSESERKRALELANKLLAEPLYRTRCEIADFLRSLAAQKPDAHDVAEFYADHESGGVEGNACGADAELRKPRPGSQMRTPAQEDALAGIESCPLSLQWISVKKLRPEKYETVVVRVDGYRTTGYWNGSVWRLDGSGTGIESPSHWMPVPPPPEEE